MTHFTDTARYLFNQPGLLSIKYTIRSLQTLLNYNDFQRVKRLTTSLPMAPLLERQPRFVYKYLSRYMAASFSRPVRLAALLNHYDFLAMKVGTGFFTLLTGQPIIWQERCGSDLFTISLSYPQRVGFEGELSLNFSMNSTLLHVLAFVIVPGSLVGLAGEQVLLISQVQGTYHTAQLLKHATKALHDIIPAVLLVNAAYGLAAALGIGHAAGISTEEQLSHGPGSVFNYDAFWQQLGGEPTANKLYLLRVPAPEKPLEAIKANHRARTLRKRQYKRLVREQVEQHCRATFLQQNT